MSPNKTATTRLSQFQSSYPSIQIPCTDLYSFIFGQLSVCSSSVPALIDAATDEQVTYPELHARINRLAAGLSARWRIKKGDVVAIYAPNTIDFVISVYAIVRLGATVTTANAAYTSKELVYQLRDANAVAILTVPSALNVARESALSVGISTSRIAVMGSRGSGDAPHIRDLMMDLEPPKIVFTQDELAQQPAFLCYSSGTTGRSKGVILTHRNITSNVAQNAAVKVTDYTQCRVWSAILPFYHVYGLVSIMAVALYQRCTLVIMEKFEFNAFLEMVQKHKVQGLQVAPPIVVQILNNPLAKQYDLSSIKAMHSAAAPLSKDIEDAVSERFGLPIKQGFGMTESGPSSHSNPNHKIKSGSIGILYPNMEAKIIHVETGQTVPIGEEGEMCLRGPNVMKGYLNNAEATRNTIDSEGWLHTGDIARADAEGYFYIVDRLKELIKYKGFQVPPAELEGILLTHPMVLDAAVIPRNDARGGEVPRAYIVLRPESCVSETEIREFVDGKVSGHKKLRGGVRFIPAIPKSPSGKILRRVLRDMDRREMAKL
ncbi:hypothetical protein SpCBS45565_g01785 [Spizellomyces sp. 'palustris']|nr:hypothetical protein SpCBS45565_g01785 [Spizellomyces sp. 'palustris']